MIKPTNQYNADYICKRAYCHNWELVADYPLKKCKRCGKEEDL